MRATVRGANYEAYVGRFGAAGNVDVSKARYVFTVGARYGSGKGGGGGPIESATEVDAASVNAVSELTGHRNHIAAVFNDID